MEPTSASVTPAAAKGNRLGVATRPLTELELHQIPNDMALFSQFQEELMLT